MRSHVAAARIGASTVRTWRTAILRFQSLADIPEIPANRARRHVVAATAVRCTPSVPRLKNTHSVPLVGLNICAPRGPS